MSLCDQSHSSAGCSSSLSTQKTRTRRTSSDQSYTMPALEMLKTLSDHRSPDISEPDEQAVGNCGRTSQEQLVHHGNTERGALPADIAEMGSREQQPHSESKETDVSIKNEDGTILVSLPASNSNSPRAQLSNDTKDSERKIVEKSVRELLHAKSDLTQYEGDLLWGWMRRLCINQFKGRILGLAIISLQSPRLGRSSARAELKVLCTLANDDEEFCKLLRDTLEVLEEHPGKSLFDGQPSIFTPSRAAPGPNKPKEECLTCLHRGVVCYGLFVVEGKCSRCREDAIEGNSTLQSRNCYWKQEHYGILTFADAQNFWGDTSSEANDDSSTETYEKDLHYTQFERELSSTPAKRSSNKASPPPNQTNLLSKQKSGLKTSTVIEVLRSGSTADVMVEEEAVNAKNTQNKLQEHAEEQLKKDHERNNSVDAETTVFNKDGGTYILLKETQSNAQGPLSDIATNEIQGEQKKPLQLLHIDDDLSQYDGNKLWTCMINRCWVYFEGPSQGRAFMSLQRLRRGKSNAETEFEILCELSGYYQPFCAKLQYFLGILENYPGTSLLKAPFNIASPPPNIVSLDKPQDQCLTCIHKGRNCGGSRRIGSRCVECHNDESNGDAATEADQCYWKYEPLGVLTYSEARDFFGYEDTCQKALKRKATESGVSDRPKKRGRRTKSIRERSSAMEYFKTPQGPFPIHLQHSRHFDHGQGYLVATIERRLVDAQGVFINSRTGVNLSDFKSIRAALEWSMWEYIKMKGKVNYYTYRPKYTFTVIRRMDSKEVSFSEEDFLQHDRQLAIDRESTANGDELARKNQSVKPGFLFICKAETPGI